MTMPIDLVLVRHGESEGNVAKSRAETGDESVFSEEFLARPSFLWRLTEMGKSQVSQANGWLQKNLLLPFDRHYVSEYLRALETAAYLDLPRALWLREFYLRERERGDMDILSPQQKRIRYSESLKRKKIDSFFWKPPNGESLAELCLRIDRILDTLHRECSDMRVIIVCHGEVMWAFRVRLERMTQSQYHALDQSKDSHDHIHYAHILHYTRRNPDTRELHPRLRWMRSVCPWDLGLSSNDWTEIARKGYLGSELLEEIEKYPRIIENSKK